MVSGARSNEFPENAMIPIRSLEKVFVSSRAIALAVAIRSGDPSLTSIEREVSTAIRILRVLTCSVVVVFP